MENKNQMPAGTWDKIDTVSEKKPKVDFQMNKPEIVVFTCNGPREFVGVDGGVFYLFDVEHEKTPKVIVTSAWSLLRGIKLETNNEPNGKVLRITKQMQKGKQYYKVEKVNTEAQVSKEDLQ